MNTDYSHLPFDAVMSRLKDKVDKMSEGANGVLLSLGEYQSLLKIHQKTQQALQELKMSETPFYRGMSKLESI